MMRIQARDTYVSKTDVIVPSGMIRLRLVIEAVGDTIVVTCRGDGSLATESGEFYRVRTPRSILNDVGTAWSHESISTSTVYRKISNTDVLPRFRSSGEVLIPESLIGKGKYALYGSITDEEMRFVRENNILPIILTQFKPYQGVRLVFSAISQKSGDHFMSRPNKTLRMILKGAGAKYSDLNFYRYIGKEKGREHGTIVFKF